MIEDNLAFLHELETVIRSRAATPSPGSYTAELMASGSKRIAQKVGEEAVELALASVCGDRKEQLDESADLLYHLLVLLADRDLALADVVEVLRARHRS